MGQTRSWHSRAAHNRGTVVLQAHTIVAQWCCKIYVFGLNALDIEKTTYMCACASTALVARSSVTLIQYTTQTFVYMQACPNWKATP